MSFIALTAIILSAFFQSCYQLTSKKSFNRYTCASGMFLITNVITLLFWSQLSEYSESVTKQAILYSFIASLFFTFWHVLIARSYNIGGDLSLVYPLATTGVMYIPIIEYLTGRNSFNIYSFVGILVVTIGIIIMQYTPGTGTKILLRLKSKERTVIYPLLAGFLYALGSYFDKEVVTHSGIVTGTMLVNFHTAYLLLIWQISITKKNFLSNFLIDYKPILISGILLFFSTYLYRITLHESPASSAVAVRQVSSIFGVILGCFFLKEHYGKQRILGSVIIVLGVFLIIGI